MSQETKIRITDGLPKLYAISGRASQYLLDSDLLMYISKYGSNPVFGPVAPKCRCTGVYDVYTFSFMAEAPTDKQRDYLIGCSVGASLKFEVDAVEGFV